MYELIWMRTGRLADERRHRDERTSLRLVGRRAQRPAWRQERKRSSRRAAGSSPFPAFLRAYRGSIADEGRPRYRQPPKQMCCPRLGATQATAPRARPFRPRARTSTQPPARYTEASLVKAMEELGVGRPSTYASVIAHHPRPRLRLEEVASGPRPELRSCLPPSAPCSSAYFGNLVDYGFTVPMEDDLPRIAPGTEEALPLAHAVLLRHFVRGASGAIGQATLHPEVSDTPGATGRRRWQRDLSEIDARPSILIPLGEGSDGQAIVARVGRYGPYLQRGEDRASGPRRRGAWTSSPYWSAPRRSWLAPPPTTAAPWAPDPDSRGRDLGEGRPLRPVRTGRRDYRGR